MFRSIARAATQAARLPRTPARQTAVVRAVSVAPMRSFVRSLGSHSGHAGAGLGAQKQRSPAEIADIQRDVDDILSTDAAASAAAHAEPYTQDPAWPKDLPMREDENGILWADYRPEKLRALQPVRNDAGDLVGRFDGEDVIFPDLEPTLEWVLTTPVELHLFEEAPIIKCYEEEAEEFAPKTAEEH